MDGSELGRRSLRVGLPKGRFLADSQRVLERLGVRSAADPRIMAHDVPRLGRVHMVKARDVAWLVRDGHLDLGVTSDEWLCESEADIDRFGRLCWCHTWLCAIVTAGARLPARNTSRAVRLVTEYPRTATAYARRQGWSNCEVLMVSGSTEAYIPGLGDLIIDCVETGSTIEANGLEVVDVILSSDIHLIGSRALPRHNRREWGRLQPVLDALLASTRSHAVSSPFAASPSAIFAEAQP